jgi:Fe2+ transport system protein FeoA
MAIEPCELADRMCDLGFSVGATVRCEMIGFLGDPMAFRILRSYSDRESCVGQSMIALRKKDARSIQMTRSKDSIHISAKDTSAADSIACRQTDTESRAVWD